MIRVVTAFRDGHLPKIFALCDDPSCGEFASYEIEGGKFPSTEVAVNAFLAASCKAGWGISVVKQLCPGHFATAQVNATASQSRIVAPGSGVAIPNFRKN